MVNLDINMDLKIWIFVMDNCFCEWTKWALVKKWVIVFMDMDGVWIRKMVHLLKSIKSINSNKNSQLSK